MTMTYFKRYRMRIDLRQFLPSQECSFPKYQFLSWTSQLLSDHAEAKYASFRNELDSHVFPCLGKWDGCERLMQEITNRDGFLPEATWLLVCRNPTEKNPCQCGTVQGILERSEHGSIQNLGIAPEHRGIGLGSELLKRSLAGFHHRGVRFVDLEVTSRNEQAIALYHRMGFTISSVVYKFADLVY